MTTNLEDLIAVPTKDEKLAELLADADAAGFPATSWQSGSVPRTLLEIEAQALVGERECVAEIAKGGYLDRSEGAWTTLLARGVFTEERVDAISTRVLATLACAANAGPYTITERTTWISDASGRRYTNISSGTLAQDGTLGLEWEAENPGSAYNVPNGTITIMSTPLAGVTVTNTGRTQDGADEEGDALLKAKCRDKWSTLGTGSTVDSYAYWARQADPEVRRVKVRPIDNMGVSADGHVTVIVAGDSGPVSPGAEAATEAYIAERQTLCAVVHVASAIENPQAIVGTVYVRAGYATAAEAEVDTNIAQLARDTDIGDTAYVAGIVEQIMLPAGVVNVVLSSPASDTALDFNEVVTFDTSGLVYVEV